MAIAYEDKGTGTQSGSGDLTVSYPAAVDADDFLVGVAWVGSTTTLEAPASGWTDLGNAVNSAIQGRFAWRDADGTEDGGSTTWACASSQDKAGIIARYSGVDPDDEIDATGTIATDSAETYEASVTTVADGASIILMMVIDGTSGVAEGDATFTGTGGITTRDHFYVAGDVIVIGDGVFATAGAQTVGFDSDAAGNDSRDAVLLAISVNPVSAGGVTFRGMALLGVGSG